LALDDEELVSLSLIDRAKLFVKLLEQETQPENSVRSLKFKRTRNLTLTDSTLPSKTKLLSIARTQLGLEKCTNVLKNDLNDKE
jgi:hypothetical protein